MVKNILWLTALFGMLTACARTAEPRALPASAPTAVELGTVEAQRLAAPAVTKLVLIDADTNRAVAGYDPIPAGATLDLSKLGRHLNVQARTRGAASVRFELDGGARTENILPFALAGDDQGKYRSWTPSLGAHVLTATPYARARAAGRPGTVAEVTLNVIEGESALTAPAVPAIPAVSQPTRGVTPPPAGKVRWDWQIGANTDADVTVIPGVQLLDLDGFAISAAKVAALKRQGVYTVCYIDAGSWEPDRPDAGRYPEALKLQQDPDWPREYFLDVRDVFRPNSVLAQLLTERLRMCKAKGFDAVEPDNLQNDENVRGGVITARQQVDFNGWIADAAHREGLAVFQKNGPDKILSKDRTGHLLVDKFDAMLNEECQQFDECGPLAEYTKRGKLVLNVEYTERALDCQLFGALGVSALRKDLGLVGGRMADYKRQDCL